MEEPRTVSVLFLAFKDSFSVWSDQTPQACRWLWLENWTLCLLVSGIRSSHTQQAELLWDFETGPDFLGAQDTRFSQPSFPANIMGTLTCSQSWWHKPCFRVAKYQFVANKQRCTNLECGEGTTWICYKCDLALMWLPSGSHNPCSGPLHPTSTGCSALHSCEKFNMVV